MKPAGKVVMARLGLDAHWRGSIVVAQALRDAGMEVIYLGNQMPEPIVAAALREKADLIGLSTLSGNHLILAPQVAQGIRNSGSKAPIILGGIVPAQDVPLLKAAGIAEVFGPGSSLAEIVSYAAEAVQRSR